MKMTKEELIARTKKFALMIIKSVEDLPNKLAGRTSGNQIIRSGTSVAANYRSAGRSRSNADFISKITIVEEKCDETLFWLELILKANLLKKDKRKELIKEADELTAIFIASGKTARQKNAESRIQNPKSAIRNQNESKIQNPKYEFRNQNTEEKENGGELFPDRQRSATDRM
jgi:four helix bundle protein